MRLRDAIKNVLEEANEAEMYEAKGSVYVQNPESADTEELSKKYKGTVRSHGENAGKGGKLSFTGSKNDLQAFRKDANQANQMAKEEVEVGGGETGTSKVAAPTGVRAKAPGNSKTQGDPMQKIQDPNNPGIEETDPENNTKAEGNAAGNLATLKTKMGEHFDAMFDGEELSEQFKEKASTIFEMAVNYRINEITEELESLYEEKLNEKVAELEESYALQLEDLTNKVDQYLNYAVEEWVMQNEVAIETSLRSEITEDFIHGLKSLFAEHYIEVPEEKVNVVEELAARVEELETKLNEAVNENIELKNSLNEMSSEEIFNEISEGLTLSQVEKFKKLAEGVDFDDVENFKNKLLIVKENYFPSTGVKKTANLLEESFDGEEPAAVASGAMSKYVRAISRTTIR